jgi:hypothetical protein
MANKQQRYLRKLTQRKPQEGTWISRVVQKVSHNGKKHDVFLERQELGIHAFVPSRKEVNCKARYKYPAERKQKGYRSHNHPASEA